MGKIKNILWDFDGVILDSMPVREIGFRKVLQDYPLDDVESLISFHNNNGGLSRYVKFKYFYEQILEEKLSEEKLNDLTSRFSTVMRELLINKDLLINDSVRFIKENYLEYNFHIVSGSDQEELRFLCKQLDIAQYFLSINGSPTPKRELVNALIDKYKYEQKCTILIGDSINDYEAAECNDIAFFGYNSTMLFESGYKYISSFGQNKMLF